MYLAISKADREACRDLDRTPSYICGKDFRTHIDHIEFRTFLEEHPEMAEVRVRMVDLGIDGDDYSTGLKEDEQGLPFTEFLAATAKTDKIYQSALADEKAIAMVGA